MNSYTKYIHISTARKFIHWFTVLLLLSLFVAVVIREYVESKSIRGLSLSVHELCGMLVLILACVRIFMVATGERSGIVRGLLPRAGHTALYLLLLFQPFIGILVAQATGGKALNLFSIQLPQFLPADEDFSDALLGMHEYIGWTFLAVIAGHVVMAIWHVYVQRDEHAQDMMPKFKATSKMEKK